MKKVEVVQNGKTITKYTFSEIDKELLKKKIPPNPCNTCSTEVRASCCGCPDYYAWVNVINVYDKHGLKDFALQIQAIRAKKEEIATAQQQVKNAISTLPTQLVSLI